MKCFSCGEVEPKLIDRVFSNGTKHVEARCPVCDRFLKFMPQEFDLKEIIMPFGKHKGLRISDLESSYLYWLLENNVVKGNLLKAVKYYLGDKEWGE